MNNTPASLAFNFSEKIHVFLPPTLSLFTVEPDVTGVRNFFQAKSTCPTSASFVAATAEEVSRSHRTPNFAPNGSAPSGEPLPHCLQHPLGSRRHIRPFASLTSSQKTSPRPFQRVRGKGECSGKVLFPPSSSRRRRQHHHRPLKRNLRCLRQMVTWRMDMLI